MPQTTAARNAGTDDIFTDTNLNFLDDIDGTVRGGAVDIGADEVPVDFTSIICENTSAGGSWADLDYTTLSDWEDAVETDLTADTTRVFSGTLTGTLAENTTVNLCAGPTDLLIDGEVVAHTASGQILIDGVTVDNELIAVPFAGYSFSAEAC